MPERCVVFGCSNVWSKEKGILLHPKPFYGKSESEKQRRMRKCVDFVKSKRAYWEPSEHSAVCSEHFHRGRLHQPIRWWSGVFPTRHARSVLSNNAANKPESEWSERKVRNFSTSFSLPVKTNRFFFRWSQMFLSFFVHYRLPSSPYAVANTIIATWLIYDFFLLSFSLVQL